MLTGSQHVPDITNLFRKLGLFFPRHLWAMGYKKDPLDSADRLVLSELIVHQREE